MVSTAAFLLLALLCVLQNSLALLDPAVRELRKTVHAISINQELGFNEALNAIVEESKTIAQNHDVSLRSLTARYERDLQTTTKCSAVAPVVSYENYSNWMEFYESKDNEELFDITLPGSHDSAAYNLFHDFNQNDPAYSALEEVISMGIGEAIIAPIACRFALTQRLSITEQLTSGIRYFDIRASIDEGVWRTYHLLFGPPVSDVLQQMKDFLDIHSNEIIVVEFNNMYGDETAEQRKDLATMLDQMFGSKLYPSTKAFTETITEMQRMGYQLIVSVEDDQIAGLSENLWTSSIIKNTYANSQELTSMIEFNDEKLKEFAALSSSTKTFFKLSWTLTPSSGFIQDNVFDTSASLYGLATTANAEMEQYIDRKRQQGTSQFGQLLVMDYVGQNVDMVKVLRLGKSSGEIVGEDSPKSSEQDTPDTDPAFRLSPTLGCLMVIFVQYLSSLC